MPNIPSNTLSTITFPTIILRHRKENLKKCSLSGLETNKNLLFFTYPKDFLLPFPPENYLLLDLDGPVLSEKDENFGLFLIDSTWKYAQKMKDYVQKKNSFATRSLPSIFRTAYPRKQTDCPDPQRGLSSIEALYLAHLITKKNTEHLLDRYYWKEEFLNKNALLSKSFASYNLSPTK
jgi:pre-rRNA-processing protein TSR3